MNIILRLLYLLDVQGGILCARLFKRWVPEPYYSIPYPRKNNIPDIIEQLGGVEYLSMFIDISDIYITKYDGKSYKLVFLYKNVNKTLMWGELRVTGGIDLDVCGWKAVEVFMAVYSFMSQSVIDWDVTIGDWKNDPQRSNDCLLKDFQECIGRKIGF